MEEKEVMASSKLYSKCGIGGDINYLDRVKTEGENDAIYGEELKKLQEIYMEEKIRYPISR
jgi:hypothetical protein